MNQKEVMKWEIVSMHKQQPSREVHWDVCSSPSPAQHPAHHPPRRVCTPWVTIPINSRWHPWGLQQLHRSCSWYISALGRRGNRSSNHSQGKGSSLRREGVNEFECLTLGFPMDCSPPGSSVHGMLQARILEWVTISSSRGSSPPRDQTRISQGSCIGRQILYHWATWESS